MCKNKLAYLPFNAMLSTGILKGAIKIILDASKQQQQFGLAQKARQFFTVMLNGATFYRVRNIDFHWAKTTTAFVVKRPRCIGQQCDQMDALYF